MEKNTLKSILESLLFINEKPISISELTQIIDVQKNEIESNLTELIDEYSERKTGICIVRIAGGYQMCSTPDNSPWVKKMYQERNKQKLSIASLETLAIVAYKQPITRIEIEAIRGVKVDAMTRKLSELGLIKIAGKKDVIGKPFLYITTRNFLEYFGINSLKELPSLEEFTAIVPQNNTHNNIINPQQEKEEN